MECTKLVAVVPAKAGTHSPLRFDLERGYGLLRVDLERGYGLSRGHGVWVSAFAGTTGDRYDAISIKQRGGLLHDRRGRAVEVLQHLIDARARHRRDLELCAVGLRQELRVFHRVHEGLA